MFSDDFATCYVLAKHGEECAYAADHWLQLVFPLLMVLLEQMDHNGHLLICYNCHD